LSLHFYGSAAMLEGMPDPLSAASISSLLQSQAGLIALVVAAGGLAALLLRRGRPVDAPAVSRAEARLRRVGAAGEAQVARELARLGLPALHNVVLRGARWSVELDHLVRVPSGIRRREMSDMWAN
jgi:hypothetical protein